MKKKGFIFGLVFALVLATIVGAIYIVPILKGNKENDLEEGYRSIKVEQLEGSAVVRRSDKDLDVYINMNLRNGDTLNVNSSSSVLIKLDSDKFIYVGENSKIDLVSSEKSSEKTLIKVSEGSIVTEVKNKLKAEETFDVETPNSTMAIRGTTFKVEVKINGNNYDINYSLIEGAIRLQVIKKTEDGYNVGVFDINPMELVNITVEGNSVVKENELTEVIEKVQNNDDKVNVTNYENVDDYVNDSNVSVNKEDLKPEDVVDDLDVLSNNTPLENKLQVIAKYATFDVYKNDAKVEENQVKYESSDEYSIKATALKKEGYHVSGWLINNERATKGGSLEFKVNKNCVIEPIYEEDKSQVTAKDATFDVYKDGALVESNLTEYENKDVFTIIATATEKAGLKVVGWLLDGNKYSENETLELRVTTICTIEPIYEDIEVEEGITVTANSATFTVYVSGSIIASNVSTYTNESGFHIIAYANDFEGHRVCGWTVDGIRHNTIVLEIDVSKSIVIEPIYEEGNATIYDVTLIKSIHGTIDTTEETTISGGGKTKIKCNIADDEIFLYWYKVKKTAIAELASSSEENPTPVEKEIISYDIETNIDVYEELTIYAEVIKKGEYILNMKDKDQDVTEIFIDVDSLFIPLAHQFELIFVGRDGADIRYLPIPSALIIGENCIVKYSIYDYSDYESDTFDPTQLEPIERVNTSIRGVYRIIFCIEKKPDIYSTEPKADVYVYVGLDD